jgi:hypothetical protein
MEATACRDALRIYLETDCLELIQMWEKGDFQRSIAGSLLTEINELRLAFREFVFKYVSRNCNKVAHVVAKQVTAHISRKCGM